MSCSTGGQDGKVRVFDLTTGEPAASFQAASDTVNGLMFHPCLPLLATASGTGTGRYARQQHPP